MDDMELPDFDDVAAAITTLDDLDKQTAADSELESLSPQKSISDPQIVDVHDTSDPQRAAAISQIVAVYGDENVAIAALDAIADYAPNNLSHALNWIGDHPAEVQKAKEGGYRSKATTTKMIVPLEVEAAPSTTAGSTSGTKPQSDTYGERSNGGNAMDNDDGIDWQGKLTDCVDSTKECCGTCGAWCANCGETVSDGYDGLSQTEKYTVWGCCGSFCCIGLILAAILIPVSLRKVEFDEYAIKYDGLTREEDSQEYGEGRYLFTPDTYLFRYDALIQKLSLELECLTSDGIVMEIDVDIQYSIPQNNVFEIWDEFGKEDQIDEYFALVAADAVRDGVGAFTAAAFYQNRYGIQQRIEDEILLATEEAKTHLLLNNAVMSRYSFPEILKETIRQKRAAENLISVAENQRDGNLTDADTDYVVATVFAQQLAIQGQAEVDSLLAEADAHASAVTARFQLLTDLFVENQRALNFTASEFIEYWLTAFVLQTATSPITNTGGDTVVVKGGSKPTTTALNDTMTTEFITTAPSNTTQYFTTTN